MDIAFIAVVVLAASGWTLAIAERDRRQNAERLARTAPPTSASAVVVSSPPSSEARAVGALREEFIGKAVTELIADGHPKKEAQAIAEGMFQQASLDY